MSTSAQLLPLVIPGVEDALRSCASVLAARGRGAWEVQAAAPGAPRVLAQVDGEWLLLTAPARRQPRGDWDALLRAGTVPPFFKLARASRGNLVVRADLPAGERPLRAERVAQAIKAFPAALAITASQTAPGRPTPPGPGSTNPSDPEPLAELLVQSGWVGTPAGDGTLAAALETPGEPRRAEVERAGRGVRLAVKVGQWPRLGAASRAALGIFLLSLSHALRLARGFARESEAGVAAGFDILLPAEPTGAELEHALSALSVACRNGAGEIVALEDDALAKEYLRVRGEKTKPTNNERKKS